MKRVQHGSVVHAVHRGGKIVHNTQSKGGCTDKRSKRVPHTPCRLALHTCNVDKQIHASYQRASTGFNGQTRYTTWSLVAYKQHIHIHLILLY